MCKAAPDTWPPPLPGSQQCSLAAGSCVQRHKFSKTSKGDVMTGRRAKGVFLKGQCAVPGRTRRTQLIGSSLSITGKERTKQRPPGLSSAGHRKGAAENSVQRGLDLRTAGAHHEEERTNVLGRTKLGRGCCSRAVESNGRLRACSLCVLEPNLQGLEPDDLRWSRCHNRNTLHSNWHDIESSRPTPNNWHDRESSR